MRLGILVALLAAAAAAGEAAFAAETVALGGEAEFDALVGGLKPGGGAFVKFYAPWCGHCKRLAPAWASLGRAAAAQQGAAAVAKVDCTTDGGKALCAREGVTGYPTLRLYRPAEEPETHKGKRDLLALKRYLAAAGLYTLGDADLPQPAFRPMGGAEKGAEADTRELVTNAAVSLGLLAAAAAYLCWPRRRPVSVQRAPAEPIVDLASNAELDALLASRPAAGVTVVDFHAEWCGPCKRIRPDIERINAQEEAVRFAAVDVDAAKEVADRFRVRSMPTFLFFKGDRLVTRVEGANVQGVVEKIFYTKRLA